MGSFGSAPRRRGRTRINRLRRRTTTPQELGIINYQSSIINPKAPYHLLATLSGLGWGLFVVYVIFEGTGDAPIVGGLLASPAIGLAVGASTQKWRRWSIPVRIGVSLVSLYAAAALFGLGVGLYDWLIIGGPNRIPHAVVTQAVLAYLWGLTFTGFLVVLWPMAFVNHWLLGLLLGRREERVDV